MSVIEQTGMELLALIPLNIP